MVLLTEKFRFIRDDVFLCPWVDTATGKQKLIMQKINLKTNEVEFEDFINCIHTAITDISPKEFEDYHNYVNVKEQLLNKTLEIRSSEYLEEIILTPKEKFIALKSWAVGITEAGMDAFNIQNEIDKSSTLHYPIVAIMVRFLAKVDLEFFREFLWDVERNYMFEGKKHKSSIIAVLISILKPFFHEYKQKKNNIFFEAADIIENLGLSNKIMRCIYHEVYEIEENELSSHSSITKDISNIRGLKYLNNLKIMQLSGNNIILENKIREIKGLDHLTELRELNLGDNKITKIEGLDQLTNLKELYLGGNKITKIEGLEKLKNLRNLMLYGNKITKIEGLDQLTNLKELYLGDNKITKIQGLDQLTNLKELYLGDNKITKFEGLDQLTNLKELYLRGNKITKIEGLDHLPPNLKDYLPPNLEVLYLEGYSFRSQIAT